jgi:hypothetical protein
VGGSGSGSDRLGAEAAIYESSNRRCGIFQEDLACLERSKTHPVTIMSPSLYVCATMTSERQNNENNSDLMLNEMEI